MEPTSYKMFCEECGKDVPVEKMDDGTIVISCPKCIGECGSCDCHLVNHCFSDQDKVEVRHTPDAEGPVNGN